MKSTKSGKAMQLRQGQQGLTLVELMIAMTLGIILTYGITEIYINSKQTYRTQDGLSRMQESARFALDFISRDIRSTGFVGCGNLSDVTANVVTTTPALGIYDLSNVLLGYQNTGTQNWSPTLPAAVTNAVDDTDVITTTGAGRCTTVLTGDMADSSANVTIATTNACGFQQNDVVLISNCSTADVFRITNDPGSSGTLVHGGLATAYTTTTATEVMSYTSNSYYIRNDATSGLPSLYVLDNSQATGGNNPIALIEGVENMQLQYGVDTNNDGVPEQYSDANSVADWTQVVAVRITLLMRTIENVDGPAYTFNVGGTNKQYAAGPLRKEFVTTVQIRNRGL